ncbi:ABC transporter F family member 4-like [Phoenix dactylifera]|uniref:ABC transporter F family member 4-like n=1 Tax=Phoenix dactylifera TaxID=42345 RepID=A0A8B7CW03_PHODC|nr:ABC transporter F family member 4-like [Phoenix dactylifera]
MAEEKVKPVKREEEEVDDDDDNVPIAASSAKPVKKKEPKEEEEDDDLPLVLSKNKKRKHDAPSKPKKEKLDGEEDQKIKKMDGGKSNARPSKAKKDLEEQDGKADKEKKKKKKKKEEERKVVGKKGRGAASPSKEKKEKKVYDFPGQKHNPPEERDPLRIFYETLYQQVPNSEMAAFWMMEWGLLSLEEAKEVYEKKLKKAQQQKLGSPVKPVSVKKTATVSVKKVKGTVSKAAVIVTTKRKASDSEADDDEDFIVHKKTIKKQKVSS